MNEEIKSMRDNDVWDLFPLPKGAKSIGCKWIFKIKRDSKGNVERYKARLIAKGFTQKEAIDYKETFPLVSSKDSFRIIMALVAYFDIEWHQMDVKIYFDIFAIHDYKVTHIAQVGDCWILNPYRLSPYKSDQLSLDNFGL